jgi:GT2 family glycosyltransferase
MTGVDPSRLGVVVLTHGDGAPAFPLVQSLLDDGVPPSSIAVVHNILTDDQDPIRPADRTVTVLRMAGNLGYAAGMNAGVQHHLERECELVLLLTHDVSLRDGAIDALLEAARAAPDFGVLGPVVWWRSAGIPFSYGGVHIAAGIPSQARDAPRPSNPAGISPCDWVEGCAMLIRRAVFEQAGPFDERFFLYFEETEFCLRAARAGWPAGVVLDAAVEQEPGLDRWPGAYVYLMARNGLEYARLRDGGSGLLSAVRRHTSESWQSIRVCASPRSSAGQKRQNAIRLRARWRGMADFARRRWGPPPPTLPGVGTPGAGGKEPPEMGADLDADPV